MRGKLVHAAASTLTALISLPEILADLCGTVAKQLAVRAPM